MHGYAGARHPARVNSYSSSASIWYSHIPGRQMRMARSWAAALTSAALRIAPISALLLNSRISWTRWSSITNSPRPPLVRAPARTRATHSSMRRSNSG